MLIAAGIEGWSIPDLLRFKITNRPGSGGGNSSSGPGGGATPPQSKGIIQDPAGTQSPLMSTAAYARIDQGVDYSQSQPYTALATGTVEDVVSSWAGGTGKAVYVKMNTPVVVNGRTYQEYYVAETTPLVSKGQRIRVGQQIASGGAAELGFLINGKPATLVGGLGAGTKPTQAGQDFFDLIQYLISGSYRGGSTYQAK